MPVAALHSLPAVLGAGCRRRRGAARQAARFGLRASSVDTATVSVNGEVINNKVVERKTTPTEDEDVLVAKEEEGQERPAGLEALYDDGFGSVTVKDYFAAARAVSQDDGGPPRWFCPVECGRPAVEDAPLLLFLPGTDGVGMGLILHHKSLGKKLVELEIYALTTFSFFTNVRVFEVRCLHIPVNDRTPFEGDPLKMASVSIENNLSPPETLQKLSDSLTSMLPLLSELADIIPRDTLLWKLKLLKTGAAYANSRLHAVQAEVLLLASGNDNLLPSGEEADRLFKTLKNCRVRYFKDNGHTLLLEDGINLLSVIKGVNMYRRGRQRDFVTDYLPPSLSEFKKTFDEDHKLFHLALGSVMMSTLKNGKIVRGLAGIPDKGPVLFVGYHALMGIELSPLYEEFLRMKKTIVRGMAHPFLFGGKFESSRQEFSRFDTVSMYGGLPVTPINMYRLFERNQFVLLYPGGVREALHRKGEEYKLFWPDQPEFVRMAARFGVTIIPFGCVGEDDVLELVLDYNDQKNIPFLREWIESINKETQRVRDSVKGEEGNQDMYLPAVVPKMTPGTSRKASQLTAMATLSLSTHSQATALWQLRRRRLGFVERISYQFSHAGRLQASYRGLEALYDDGYQKVKDLDYYYRAIGALVEHDSGPPRWFCPVDARAPIEDAPIMLYLPATSFENSDIQKLLSVVSMFSDHASMALTALLNYNIDNELEMAVSSMINGKNPLAALTRLTTVLTGYFQANLKPTGYRSCYLNAKSTSSRNMGTAYCCDLRFRTCPVMYSTMEDDTVVRGLAGVPQDGPVLLVGNHMLLGIELISLAAEFLRHKGIVVRGIAHPLLFPNKMRAWSQGHDFFDFLNLWGGVPLKYKSIYQLLDAGEFVLLYPGGHREALHCKGEAHRLFWPAQAEFVRMAAQFNATIVPFGVVGEDDLVEILCTFEDIRNAPFGKEMIQAYSNHLKLRDVDHEVIFPGMYLKMPGRFYYRFGKPIPTRGREDVLTDKQAANDLYLHVKSEVESMISYLLEKRVEDNYRSLIPRMLFQAARGPNCEVPSFDP
ncbi:hypothetical protein PR202_gb20354 [Eleusine coracana subsp. coracana]|uniref:Uncharacterized protein n=1 Tax=Eleusine coracana subsp. coracana TaxID=191504 RepID=A0AAV5F8C3_ELECO|nr:hypothetical protein PR202_gb20354 [Eleusine coracana subsp. coracana]